MPLLSFSFPVCKMAINGHNRPTCLGYHGASGTSTMPAGPEKVPCPVLTILTDGLRGLLPKRSLICKHSGLPAGAGGTFPDGETEAWRS